MLGYTCLDKPTYFISEGDSHGVYDSLQIKGSICIWVDCIVCGEVMNGGICLSGDRSCAPVKCTDS
ncbi:hypothetical protein DPMN_193753 [Dreissena polymorpha]|uniref:Uncharacterized protein n=1 Tax=Dreissena polymorpha TaxID=45954 RepID=A0A9D3Y202_DREPO|nr:hypothetical protein DPMN_193753 [Dreissena polymorpha]